MRRIGALWLWGLLAIAGCGTQSPPDYFAAGRYAAALRQLPARAAAGEAKAWNQLGILHYLGLGTSVNYREAARCFKAGALAGDAHAMRNLGSMFRQGLGVPHDDIRAFGWYDAARRHGNDGATGYMQLMAQFVGWNQQAYARRIVAGDLEKQAVSDCGAGLLMSACPAETPN